MNHAAGISTDAPRRPVRALLVCLASILVVVCAGVALRTTTDFDATADGAAISLATIEAIKRQALLGPYSQYGWHHPGPLLFYLLAPMYRLSGYNEMALRWMALLLNVVAVGWTVALLRRHASTLMAALTAIAACAIAIRAGGDFTFSIWNPLVTVFPLGLLAVLNAGAMSGRAVLLPWSALVASFLIQTDIAFAPAVLAMEALCLAVVIVRALKPPSSGARAFRRAAHQSAWLLVAVWCLPLAEELVHRPRGNLDLIADYFRKPAQVQHSFPQAFAFFAHNYVGVAAASFTSALGHFAPESFPAWESIAAIGLLAGGIALTWVKRASAFERALSGLCVVGAITGLWSATRIPVRFMDYQLFWIAILGALTLAALTDAVLVRTVNRRWLDSLGLRIAAAAMVLATLGLTVTRVVAWQRDASSDRTISMLHDDLERYAEANAIDRPVLYHTGATWGDAVGLVLASVKSHDAIAVDDDLIDIVGEHYRAGADDVHCVGLYDADADAKLIANGQEFARRGRLVLAAISAGSGCQLSR